MPTYVYKCDACGNQFEHFQSFKEAPLETCPCGQSGAVRRVFQPVGIVFKGSGWYINDSRASNGKTSNGKTSNGKASDTGDKSDTSSSSSSDTSTTPTTTTSTSSDSTD